MIISSLKINGMDKPMGYAFSGISVSFRVEKSKSQKQKNTIVTIAKDADFKSVISQKSGVLSSASVVMDVALQPRTTYFVKVEVEGEQGDTASQTTSFDTGKMNEAWEARFIGPSEGFSAHPVLSKRFSISKGIARARLYITGVGLYCAKMNGEKIGEDILAPFFNDYFSAIQTQTYAVEKYLIDKNILEISLGNGWYKGHLGWNGQSEVFGNRFAAIAELHIEYTDGTKEVVLTDDTWRVSPSDFTYTDIYNGEGVDRTQYKDNRPFEAVSYVDMSDKKLVDRYSMPLKIMEEVSVKEIITTKSGETVLDFGQNFAGFVSFHVKGFESGTKVTLEHGEVLQNGNFYHDNYRTAKTLITYVSDGREEWYTPTFTYMGFRYVKVTGWPKDIKGEDFVGKVVYSAMERTGYLESDHPKVNRLFANALWGLKSNFLDMPTDCPQRDERLGWTGDAQVFAPTASFFMDTKSFYRKFLWDMRNDQVKRDGAIASYLPNFDGAPVAAAVWADAATFIPDTVYKTFGDIELLKEAYPLMKDWVDYVTRQTEEHGTNYLYNFAFTYGDWLAMDGVTEQSVKGGTEDAYISCVYYYASAVKVANAAKELGYQDDVKYYEELCQKIRSSIVNEYFTPSGRLAIDTQSGYITALQFGIYKDKAVLANGLKSRLKRDGNRLRCGFVGAPLLCETLADNGMIDLAMHLFLQEKFPSWLHCVNLGATTIWERWNSLLDDGSISGTGMNSLNHYSYGSITNFAVKCIAGFRATSKAFKSVRITPNPDARLGKLNLTYTSVSGTYVANWKIEEDGTISLHYEVPFDCSAEIVIPESGELKTLSSGTYDFTIHPKRDYRSLYSENTMLDELGSNPEAMKILLEEAPAAFGMASGNDAEALSFTLGELKYQPWFGCTADQIDRVLKRLSTLRVK